MAYTAINSSEIATGEPVKAEVQTKIKDNFDDHESRIGTLESAINSFRPLEFVVKGMYSKFGSGQTDVLFDRINFNLTLLAARLVIDKAGTAGTTEVDVYYKRGVGAWTSIFSTKPSVAFGAGDKGISTNAVLSTTALQAGDLLRMDITSTQTLGNGFTLFLEYER